MCGFPFYPLCMERCITETYAMAYECYRKMIELYGSGNVSTDQFSPAARWHLALRRTTARSPSRYRSQGRIVAVSPGEVPWSDAERYGCGHSMKGDVSIDYAFMVTVEKFMHRHGCENVPDYMLSSSREIYRRRRYPLLLFCRRGYSTAHCRTSRKPANGQTSLYGVCPPED